MDKNQIRIKEIFLKAIELPSEERMAFIKKECGEDTEMIEEVQSLVQNHNEDSIFEAPIQKRMETTQSKEESEFEITLKKIQKKRNQKLRYNLLLIGVIITLISIGIWIQQQMKSSIIGLNEHSLEHNLQATTHSLDDWIKDKANITEALSRDSMIIASTNFLTQKYGMGKFGHPDSIWNDPVHRALVARLNPIIEILESPSFSIIDASGFRVACNVKKRLGEKLNEDGMRIVLPKLQTDGFKFTRPFLQERSSIQNNSSDSTMISICWLDCSIKSEENAIATLGFAFFAETGFNEILEAHRIGKTGHTYAFDEKGYLISSVDDVDELKNYGILEEFEDPTLNLKLIDLKGALKENNTLDLAKYESGKLILPVRLALSDKKHKEARDIQTVPEPYYTFNGNKTIGAYVWLPKYNIGIITELPTEETLKPVHYLNLILIILIGLLIGFVIYSFISSYQVAKLHKEIGETSMLGQYTLIKHIGEGGMGEVYLAKHAFLSRPNAVKLLKSEFSHNKDTIKRFEREVQLASQLTNPHTIQIHDFGYTEGDRFYYAMEFLEGITLEDLIKIEGPLPLNRTIVLLKQICYSLSETHEHGLVHRDIKPMNIMICKLGGLYDFVKVLDFGLVKDIEGDDLEMTQEAVIQGTPVYMAPERFLRPQLSHPKSDIYSIGMVAYYLITGRKVFDHIDKASLLSDILHTQPKEMNEFTNEDLPEEFTKLVMSCLAKEMDDRPENIGEILSTLSNMSVKGWNQTKAKEWWIQHIEQNK